MDKEKSEPPLPEARPGRLRGNSHQGMAALISRSQRSQVLGSHQTAEKSEGHDRCRQGLAENLVLRGNEGKGGASGGFGGRAAMGFERDDFAIKGIGDWQAVHKVEWVEVLNRAWVVLPNAN